MSYDPYEWMCARCGKQGRGLGARPHEGRGRDHLRALQALAAFAVALLLAVLALEFYVIRMLAAGLVVLALLACG